MYVAVGDPPFLRRRGYINTRLCCVTARVCVDECRAAVFCCELVSGGAAAEPAAVCLCGCSFKPGFFYFNFTYLFFRSGIIRFVSISSPPLSPEEV